MSLGTNISYLRKQKKTDAGTICGNHERYQTNGIEMGSRRSDTGTCEAG
ncbi:MAG: hypothetical protein MSA09_06290 [Lachnospiraceae bacterium]|nr:hypothetical protein [Lachnospiraceae bacterium]